MTTPVSEARGLARQLVTTILMAQHSEVDWFVAEATKDPATARLVVEDLAATTCTVLLEWTDSFDEARATWQRLVSQWADVEAGTEDMDGDG